MSSLHGPESPTVLIPSSKLTKKSGNVVHKRMTCITPSALPLEISGSRSRLD
jgi:hypothetical protein